MQWWEPNQLKRVDAEFRNKSTIDECDPHNDFGSYRRLLLGDSLESSQIAEHNDISPEIKITLIKRCLHLDNINSRRWLRSWLHGKCFGKDFSGSKRIGD